MPSESRSPGETAATAPPESQLGAAMTASGHDTALSTPLTRSVNVRVRWEPRLSDTQVTGADCTGRSGYLRVWSQAGEAVGTADDCGELGVPLVTARKVRPPSSCEPDPTGPGRSSLTGRSGSP